jgi:hypothetical protein
MIPGIGNANGRHPKPEVLDKPRARRDAAKALGLALQTRYRRFLESAGDEDATVIATGDLAQCMYENVEFVIWALKSVGGMNPPPPEVLRPISKGMSGSLPANDPRFAKPPEPVLEEEKPLDLPCTCPPLEHGIIGRERHMTSCPKFKP